MAQSPSRKHHSQQLTVAMQSHSESSARLHSGAIATNTPGKDNFSSRGREYPRQELKTTDAAFKSIAQTQNSSPEPPLRGKRFGSQGADGIPSLDQSKGPGGRRRPHAFEARTREPPSGPGRSQWG